MLSTLDQTALAPDQEEFVLDQPTLAKVSKLDAAVGKFSSMPSQHEDADTVANSVSIRAGELVVFTYGLSDKTVKIMSEALQRAVAVFQPESEYQELRDNVLRCVEKVPLQKVPFKNILVASA